MQAVLLLSVTVSGIVGTMCGCESSMPVLMEFYNATNGLTWAQSNGWGSADCNVSWFGVTCSLINRTDGSSAITEVNLTSNNLSGSLTESLVNLTAMQSLLLGSNHISGTLPAKWRMFDFLYQLDLSSNNLHGSIPSNWTSIDLRTVDFSRNSFAGSLAESFSINLESIDFSENQITGSLPASWASFADIDFLSVARNKLEGTLPESWKTMGTNGSGLVLILSYNRIGGSLPGNWSQLTMIKELHFDHNNLHGPLPESWSTMESHVFFSLVLDSNPIRATLPSSWKGARAGGILTIFDFVAVLSLANCSLYGTLPESWTFPTIEHLFLNDNALSGTMPMSWEEMGGGADEFHFANISNNCLSGVVYWSNLLSGDPPPVMDTCGTRLDLATGNCTRLPTFWPEYCAPRAHWNTGTRTFAASSKTVSGGTGSRRERRTNDVLQTGHVEESSSVSLTVSASISAHLVVAVNSAFTTASSSSLTLAVLVSGLSGTAGHGGVVALQRSLGVIRLTSTCTSGASNDDSSSSADFSGWPENILTLAVPISSNSAVLNGAAGSVIGNAVLLAVFSAMLHGVWIILHQSSIKISSCCSRVARCIPSASLPGSMASMYSLMMPPSINAALVLITSTLSTTSSVGVGCIALAVWLCPLCYFSYQLLYRCRISTSDAGQRSFVLRSSFLPIAQRKSTRQQWTRYWMHPVTTNWAVAADRGALLREDDARNVAIFALTRLEPLFSGFVPRRTWFQLAQWAVSLTSSVAVGLAMGAGSCNAATIGASIALALTALEPLLLLVLRPLRVRFELAVSVFVGCIALAADTFAFLQWSSVSSNCVLAGSLMDVVATTSVLLFEACGGRRSMRGEELTTLVEHNEMTNLSQCDRRKQRAFLSQQQALKTLVNLICNSRATTSSRELRTKMHWKKGARATCNSA